MIVKEQITIGGKAFTRTYSDEKCYIERDGVRYSEAIDPAETGRVYLQTRIPIENEEAAQ